MAAKFFIICATALLVQVACGQFLNSGLISGNAGYLGNAGLGLATPTLGTSGLVSGIGGYGGLYGGSIANTGLIGASSNVIYSGPLIVTTASPISPTGLAVATELVIDGNVVVSGALPFLSAVAFEAALPSAGSGVATCGCGTGSVGILGEGYGYAGIY